MACVVLPFFVARTGDGAVWVTFLIGIPGPRAVINDRQNVG